MKKTTLFVLLGLFFLPLSVSAAWWNPFSWKKVPVPVDAVATSTASTTLALPSVDELYKRIAELEQKLDEARANMKKTADSVKANVQTVVTSAVSSGLSEKDILSKVRPAIIFIETATSSGAGTIIDAQGHILTNAHSVWNKNGSGNVVGAASEATITFSNGTKKKAFLVGIDEATDIAVLQLSDKKSSSYVSLNYDSGVAVGDKVYAFGFTSEQSNTKGSFLAGSVIQKTSSSIKADTDGRPLDNGGAIVTSKGSFIGIPSTITCKVLEEMQTCLKYTVTANFFPAKVTKILAGMKLYKDKKNRTAGEALFRGYLDGVYNNINQTNAVDIAVENATGKNSFDYFNDRLGDDVEGKMTKIYINKLKSTSENIYKGFDFLKSISYALKISLINDSSYMSELDPYQKQIITKIQADNESKLKEYQSKVDLWSKKKNEYDSYLTRLSEATDDYLMAQGVVVETAADYLKKEKIKLLETFSGENVAIF